ncbi:ScbA/BarX family gamma-butyrolactone biosynthesis protein [Streptacidiphilus sp. PAMC 29251]
MVQIQIPRDQVPASLPLHSALHSTPEHRSTAVPTELVHRPDPQDVFLTGWTRVTDTRFAVTANWPLAHRFFTPVSGSHQDPLLIAETLRQAAILLAHTEFAVPLDDHFVMWDLSYTTSPQGVALDLASGDIAVDVRCTDIRRRGPGLSGMRVELVFRSGSTVLATGAGSLGCTSPRAYRRIRGEHLEEIGRPVPLLNGVPPLAAGRTSHDDVVLAPTPHANLWQVRLDTHHPTLYGRPGDHVPGMLLLEAARQAATATDPEHSFLPLSVEIAFHRYAELHSPCWIESAPVESEGPTTSVRVWGQQDGEPVFSCTIGSLLPRAS